ncbi:MAG: hypothetical protein IBX52_07515 [Bacterioplanes sp.]|nr:hypothetical protein [Bacterioplanes sp.]
MNPDMFERIKGLSLEIQSLVKQGVKEGVAERIDVRNDLLKKWFAEINELIEMTNDQQLFLEQLLQEEQGLVRQLEQEQKGLAKQQQGAKNSAKYQHIANQ